MTEDKVKSKMNPEIDRIVLMGYITKVIDDEKGEYEMRFKPNIFEHVKNMEDLK